MIINNFFMPQTTKAKICKFNADALIDLTKKAQMKMMINMATLPRC